jgi:hypothetical protein
MKPSQRKPQKVKVTLSITKAAADVLNFAGYCSDRERGEFISWLIVEYHQRQQAERAQQTRSGTASST